ncbi:MULTISPECIES: GyrI-like domain-containing protein [Vagococcus]|uniref:Transcriptional regulator, AraC family n=1 Tax=Vagococcus fluvialis bH819 TaxID=1255619 RepID=A0A1X6WPR6_9ENTE|nr:MULTISPECIES: GyrI-like domain-containing protein [Vagococcus]SLM86258.1 Transcriptional regulator, AraC family [Vagococcus fluvialis bH819]HCM88914.1 AraC family transcriptional regulator [Vagococcus sp.]
MIKPINITTEQLEDQKIIYIRFRGSQAEFRKNSRKLFNELFEFATNNYLVNSELTKVLTIYDDNPYITEDKNLRTSVAMTIPNNINVTESGNICISSISGKFGVGHFEISAKEYGSAWQYMYQEWLFKDDSQARDAVPFELYVTEPPKNFKDKSLTNIYIPIN